MKKIKVIVNPGKNHFHIRMEMDGYEPLTVMVKDLNDTKHLTNFILRAWLKHRNDLPNLIVIEGHIDIQYEFDRIYNYEVIKFVNCVVN